MLSPRGHGVVVTRDLPKVETTGSSPVARSRSSFPSEVSNGASLSAAPWSAWRIRGQDWWFAPHVTILALLICAATAMALATNLPVPRVLAGPMPPPTRLTDRSTLTILRGGGQYSALARGAAVAAIDGQDVSVGDRVITGGDADLILTFFEGTTFALTPNTDITLQRIQGQPDGRDISIGLNAGTIWARVVSVGTSSATFEVQTPNATAVVRGSQIGARVAPDGTFQCWTREGQMSVVTPTGQQTTLNPGETVVVAPDGTLSTNRVFSASLSVLRVRTDGAVWPLIVHPHGGANGVADPGIVVSQTFGAFVARPGPGSTTQQFEVPASVAGEYMLVLEGRDVGGSGAGSYRVGLTGLLVQLYTGTDDASEEMVEAHELSGNLLPGERLAYAISVQVEPSGDKEGVLQRFTVAGPLPVTDALGPAKVLVSPEEIALAGLAQP